MEHGDYTVEDFLMDDSFRRWVLYSDPSCSDFWERWIKGHPDKLPIVEEARSIILSVEFDEAKDFEAKNSEMWEAISDRIEGGEANEDVYDEESTWRHRDFNYTVFYRAAAVFACVLSLSAIYYFTWFNAYKEYATNYGEIRTVLLPDSSEVVLNAHTTLTLHSTWDVEKPREVWIDGEAFFHVRKTPARSNEKFIVHTNGVEVEVLGTSFNVNNRRGKTRVILSSGKVKLKRDQSASEGLILRPGEFAEFNKVAGKFTVRAVETELYTSWRNNELVFDGSTLGEIGMILEDNYGFKVVIEDEDLVARKFKGTFPANDPDILLTALMESFDLKLVRTGNQLVLRSN